MNNPRWKKKSNMHLMYTHTHYNMVNLLRKANREFKVQPNKMELFYDSYEPCNSEDYIFLPLSSDSLTYCFVIFTRLL